MSIPAGPWYIDDLLTWTVNTINVATGAATDADSVPTYRIYEDETGTPILTGSMAKLDDANTTGFYSEQITLSAANGFEVGKSYAIYVAATVNAVASTQSFNFKVIAAIVAAPTAGSIAAAVWDEDATGHQTQGTFGQAIGDPAADADTIWSLCNTNLNTTISSRASQSSVTTVDTVVDAIKVKTDSLTFTVAGQVDANMQSINDKLLTGDGSAGDKFGPA